jgi:tripartite-type tricarboxylate transporter receptor subunit TctC
MIVVFPSRVFAQIYPNKPIRFVVPSAAGGSTDTMGRIIGQKLTSSLGQIVVVDNRPRAAGIIGSEIIAKSPPDGYAVLLAPGSHAINASLYSRLPYDPLKDFDPAIHICILTSILVVHPSLPVRSVGELMEFARARPGQINFASAGSGTSDHLTGELFKFMAKVDIAHIPHRAGPAVIDLVAGQVSLMFASIAGTIVYVHAGKLRVLGVTSAARSPLLPNVPTVAESGISGFDANGWVGVLVPAGTPKNIIGKLNSEIGRVLGAPEVLERFGNLGATAVGGSPDKFGVFIRDEINKWGKIVRASGVRVD